MKASIYIFMLFLCHLEAHAIDICSSEAKSDLKKMGTDMANLEKYCTKTEVQPAKKKIYDLASEKNDFAEVIDDLNSGSAIGAEIKFTLSASMMGAFCIQGVVISGKSTLSCIAKPGSQTVYVISKDKNVRIELLRKRDSSETKIMIGKIIEGWSSKPVIEIQ